MLKAVHINDKILMDKRISLNFLKKYRAEVLGMLLEEFDVKKYERSLREEEYENAKKGVKQ